MIDGGGNGASFRMLGDPQRVELRLACVLVVVAFLLGGGGSPTPLPEMVLQMLTAAIAIAWIWLKPHALGKIDGAVIAAAGLVVILPLLQLIPLPPSIWQNLPGREAQLAALTLIEAQDGWRPLSIAPPLTLAALLSLGTPVLALLLTSRLSQRERFVLVAVVGLGAALSLFPGVVQVMSDGNLGHFYAQTHRGVVTGFHANRNASADLLLIGIVASPILARFGPAQSDKPIAFLLVGILSVGVLLTQSRTGLAILPLAILFAAIVLQLVHGGAVAWRSIAKWGAMIVAGFTAIVVVALYAGPSRVANALVRFSARNDLRVELWQDGWFAAGQYGPFGSGIGTIQPVLIAAERLEVVDPSAPNRVHNDFLEYGVEAGVFGPLVATILVVIGVRMARVSLGQGSLQRILVLFATFALLALAIHSIMDYPLRSMSLATLAGLAFGLLSPSVKRQRGPNEGKRQADDLM